MSLEELMFLLGYTIVVVVATLAWMVILGYATWV